MGFFFQETQEQVRNSRGERVISVRATEGLHIHTYVRTYVRTIWNGRVRPWCRARGRLDFSSRLYFFLPLSLSLCETARYTLKYCLKGPLNPRQPTTSCLFHCLSVCLPVCMIVCLLVHGCCLSFCFQF